MLIDDWDGLHFEGEVNQEKDVGQRHAVFYLSTFPCCHWLTCDHCFLCLKVFLLTTVFWAFFYCGWSNGVAGVSVASCWGNARGGGP